MEERRINNVIPDQLIPVFRQIGSDMAAARKIRSMSQADMAERLNVSRKTVVAMEKGDPRVNFGAYVMVSWVLGLENGFLKVFDQQSDPVFQREARLGLRERIHPVRDNAIGDLDF